MGTGINRIRQAMLEARLPVPTFEYDGYFVVTLGKKSFIEGGIEGGIEGASNVNAELKISLKQNDVLNLIWYK